MTNIELLLILNSIHCLIWFGVWSNKNWFNVVVKTTFLLFGIVNLLYVFGKLPV